MNAAPAGTRKIRIRIETPTETIAASGAVTVGDPWETFATMWASMAETGGTELWRAQQVNPEVSSIFKTLWIRGVTPKMRIVWEDPAERVTRYFGIEAVFGGRPENSLTFQCVEDVDG